MKKTFVAILLVSLALTGCKVIPTAPQPTAEIKIEPSATAEPAPTETASLEPTAEPTAAVENLPAPLFSALISSSQPNFSRMVWSADGKSLAMLASDHMVVLDAETLQQIYAFANPSIMILDFSADGRTLLTTTDQQNLTLIDLSTNQTRTIDTGAQFVTASFSPDGSLILVGTADNWKAEIYDAASGSLRLELTGFETAAPVYSVRFAENVTDVLWVSRAEVQLQNIASQELMPALSHEDFVNAVARAHSLDLIATSAAGTIDGNMLPIVHIWDAATGEKLLQMQMPQAVVALNFSADDAILAAGAADGVHLYKTADMSEAGIITDQNNGVADVRFSPADNRLAIVDGDGILRLYQINPQAN